jgi:hypothetical protein
MTKNMNGWNFCAKQMEFGKENILRIRSFMAFAHGSSYVTDMEYEIPGGAFLSHSIKRYADGPQVMSREKSSHSFTRK